MLDFAQTTAFESETLALSRTALEGPTIKRCACIATVLTYAQLC